MDNNYYLQELQTKRTSAKKKMIAGIVVFVIGFIFGWAGAILSWIDEDLVMIAAFAWPFWLIGFPLFISGIIKLVKFDRQISETKNNIAFAQQSPQQPSYVQPQRVQPQYAQPQRVQPQNVQPQYAQPQYAQPQNVQPQYAQPQQVQPQYAQPQSVQPQYAQPQNVQPQNVQPQYAQPQNVQPQYAQPQNVQPQYAQPQRVQPQYAPPRNVQPQQAQAQPQNAQPRTEEKPPVDLDWKKYNPLDAGVSYKADKDYKFHRADGFVGSVPQKFVDRTFPRCPVCCSNQPYWTISQHNQMSWKGNLYLFKCSQCQSIISMSMPDVTTLGNGGSGIAFNPNVGLTNLVVKASSGKEAGAVYAVIESVGNSGVTRECEGKEFKLEQLQDMFLRQ